MNNLVFELVPITLRIFAFNPVVEEGIDKRMKAIICKKRERLRIV